MWMTDVELRKASDTLADLGSFTRDGRRTRADELRRWIYEGTGITALDGVCRFLGGEHAYRYPDETRIGSASQLVEAWVVNGRGRGWLEWETEEVPSDAGAMVAFVFPLAVGRGSPTPQPTGSFEISVNGYPAVRFMVTRGSRRWPSRSMLFARYSLRSSVAPVGGSVSLDEVIRDDALIDDGYAVVAVPSRILSAGRPARIRLAGLIGEASSEWVRVARGGPAYTADPHVAALAWALRPPKRYVAAGRQLVVGDLHNHSGESRFLDQVQPGVGAEEACGVGDRESLFRYARDVAGLDFFCLSEHDWQMDVSDWRDLNELTERFNQQAFAVLHGYEWTSASYGHRNVYFRDQPGSLFQSQDPYLPQNSVTDTAPTPTKLWEALRSEGAVAMTVPHHMSAASFPLSLEQFYDDEFDRVAEIYSTWGDSLENDPQATYGAAHVAELAFIRSVRAGRRVGFIGSSDSHDGHPGNAQGTRRRSHQFHFLGSGLAAVYVDELSRQGIFDGLRARRCYALTGGDITLDMRVCDEPMGSVVAREQTGRFPRLDVHVESSAGLRWLVAYRNGWPIERVDAAGQHTLDWSFQDRAEPATANASYFVKAEAEDNQLAWSSPLWVTDEVLPG